MKVSIIAFGTRDDGEVGDVAPEFRIELVKVEFHLHSDMQIANGVKGVHVMPPITSFRESSVDKK